MSLHARRPHRIAAVLLFVAMASASSAHAQHTSQRSPDGLHVMINKDVGGQRWAISCNLNESTITGNVFYFDGSSPSFIVCSQRSGSSYDCYGADACTDSYCPTYSFISTVDLPAGFCDVPGSGSSCGNSSCDGGESCASCPSDCGPCGATCGDGSCNGQESCSTCSTDCGPCGPSCGDGSCNGDETCSTCSDDCGSCSGDMTWHITDYCNDGYRIDFRFFDRDHGTQWPAGGGTYYTFRYGETVSATLACTPGAQVCFGGATGNSQWGVGINDTSGCEKCCATCDGRTYQYNPSCS